MAPSEYTVEFAPSAAREFSKLARDIQERLRPRIDALAGEPRPRGAEKIRGREDQYHIRVGDYRVIYGVENDRLLVLVLRVAHRREVYRDL